MARARVKLAFIANDSVRRATYRKRRRGMMKKLNEISTLCGIEACAIVYKPQDPLPEIWPSMRGVQRVLSRFTEMPETDQSKKRVNQESYLKQMIMKAKEQLKKKRNENREKEMTIRLYQYVETGKIPDNLSLVDLKYLTRLIDQKMKEIEQKLAQMPKSQATVVAPAAAFDDGGAMNKGKGPVDVDGGQGLELILDAIEKMH